MKKFKTVIALLLSVLLIAALGTTLACDRKGLVDGKAVVKFDPNLAETGLTANDVTAIPDKSVEPGSKLVNLPLTIKGNLNPKNVGFREWCIDPEGTTPWNFNDPVEQSMTLYARWEKMFRITYHIGDTTKTINVFPGEKAARLDSEVGWHKVLGWYTNPGFTDAYDFDTAVNANLNLYVDMSDSIYISAERLSGFELNYGNEAYKDKDDNTTLVYDEEGEFCRVHFARIENSSYIYYTNLNQFIENQADGTRYGDQMVITYKNLGDATHFRFYYVVGYTKEDGTGFDYSGAGGWRKAVDIPIQSNMSEDDDWATVTVDLVQETIVDGVSEWGTADILCIPRIDSVKIVNGKSNGWFKNNDVLFKGIEFNMPAND